MRRFRHFMHNMVTAMTNNFEREKIMERVYLLHSHHLSAKFWYIVKEMSVQVAPRLLGQEYSNFRIPVEVKSQFDPVDDHKNVNKVTFSPSFYCFSSSRAEVSWERFLYCILMNTITLLTYIFCIFFPPECIFTPQKIIGETFSFQNYW